MSRAKIAGSVKLNAPTPPKQPQPHPKKWTVKNFCGIAERTKKEATK
jgi:hypothetical protein